MKRGSSDGALVSRDTVKYKMPKPEFSLSEKDLKEIKDWKVGKKYKLVLNAEMVSQSKDKDWGSDSDKDIHRASFKIHSITPEAEDDKN